MQPEGSTALPKIIPEDDVEMVQDTEEENIVSAASEPSAMFDVEMGGADLDADGDIDSDYEGGPLAEENGGAQTAEPPRGSASSPPPKVNFVLPTDQELSKPTDSPLYAESAEELVHYLLVRSYDTKI